MGVGLSGARGSDGAETRERERERTSSVRMESVLKLLSRRLEAAAAVRKATIA